MQPAKSEPVCSSCRFWLEMADEDGHELGQCRRYPPTYDGWAMTSGGDWCGELRPRGQGDQSLFYSVT